MQTRLETIGNVTVVVLLEERLDEKNAREFKRKMLPHLTGRPRVIFDLSQLKSVDSTGLGAILFFLRHLNAVGGDLKLSGMLNPVRALFELVRMHRVFDLYNTREEAVLAFRE